MERLSSFLHGTWQDGEGEGHTLFNPTTEEAVASCSTRGLDLKASLDYARTHGHDALRSMTFTQRGDLLASMSKAIHAQREELIEIGRINAGNTRGDAKFDIDGATHTLMHYAELGRSLGETTILFDGEPEPIGRGGRLNGQHVFVPKDGVAIHINAFNFPAWGLAEKAACALLAGMPVLSKPATSTAWMTYEIARILEPVMPKGTLSLLCGSAGDLLDHVEWNDVIAFTGSADTGHLIRTHPRVVDLGVAVNIEADSLNAAVLDPNAEDGSYDAFVRDVHREMTQKVGQKCTATRRIFVPEERMEEVIEDLSERFGRTVVGDPALDAVNMGPLSTLAQKQSALEGVQRLLEVADVVYGGVEGDAMGVEAGKGAFIHPTLLRAKGDCGPDSPVHDLEVFGPVATLIGYNGQASEAVKLVGYGQGCLVSSIYGDQSRFLAEAISGLARWNGRVVVIDEQVADKSLHPGLVTPQLLHGGPGRAGGGEELGGIRGMRFYQHRSALQGNGPKIARLLKQR
jgi:oxepin-CoA hydrolase/3-oxo-5,6-dehydrosuberyl-CoA semialdehyde dehydrogenase